MPIYEYACQACGSEFEDIVSATAPNPACPKCKSPDTKKLMSRCRTRSGGADAPPVGATSGGGSSCAGCSGGSCATCH